MNRAIVLTILGMACAAAPAGAAEVSATSTYVPGYKGSGQTTTTAKLVAAAGERNVVTVRTLEPRPPIAARTVVFADAGGTPLIAGPGCTAQADGTVQCPAEGSGTLSAVVQAGDQDDTVTATSPDSGFSVDLDGG